jgi:hypothetical protein
MLGRAVAGVSPGKGGWWGTRFRLTLKTLRRFDEETIDD